jgi:small GTP-binding protein
MSIVSSNEYIFRILVVGDKNVGKSSFISKYIDNEITSLNNYKLETSMKYKLLNIYGNVNNLLHIKLELWNYIYNSNDLGLYHKQAHAIILMFDLTNINSFNNIKMHLDKILLLCQKDITIIIVGNKYDKTNQYEKKEINNDMINSLKEHILYKNTEFRYIECSVYTGKNIDIIIYNLINEIKKKYTINVSYGSTKINKIMKLFNK